MEESLDSEISDAIYLAKQFLQIKIEKILISENLKKKYKLKNNPNFEIVDENKANVLHKNAIAITKISNEEIDLRNIQVIKLKSENIYLSLQFERSHYSNSELKSFVILTNKITKALQAKSRQTEIIEKLIVKQMDRLFLTTPLAVTLIDLKTGKYIKVNKLFVEQSGFEESHIIGKTANEISAFKNPEEQKLFYHLVFTKQKIDKLYIQFNNKNGKAVDCIVSSEIIEFRGKEYLLSYLVDISEQKKLENNLIEANKLAKIIAWNYDGETGKVNLPDYAFRIFENELKTEISIDEFLDLFVEGRSKSKISNAFLNGLQNGQKFSIETKIKSKEKSEKWVQVSGKFEKLKNEQYQCLGMILDIDDQKKITEIANIGNWSFDVENKNLKWSENTNYLFEADIDFVPQIDKFFKYYAEGESRDKAQKNIFEALENGIPYDQEVEIVTNSGKLKWVREIARIEKKNEKIKSIFGIIQDIDALKRTEIELQKMLDLALSQNDRLKRFSYIVSHNIRSDVSNIQYISDFLLEDHDSESKKEYLGYLNSTVTKLNDTIFDLNQVLEVQDQVSLNLTWVDIPQLIDTILSKYQTEIKESKSIIELDFSTYNKILTYEPYLVSILDALIYNALYFRNASKQTKIEIKTSIKNHKKAIEISDNGIGIDTLKYKEQLFGLYKTFHTLQTQTKGFSLYLSKVKMEALNGNINIESELGKKTTLSIIF
jgi:PAS domain S-box-containing protein